MKRIEAIIRPDKVGSVFGALKKIGHPGVMISEVEGHGNQEGLNLQVRGNTYKVDMVTKARLEVIVKENETDAIVNAIRKAAYTGEIGDGKYSSIRWMTPCGSAPVNGAKTPCNDRVR